MTSQNETLESYSSDRDGILDEFDDWYNSVGSNIDSDSTDEEIEDSNEKVQEFLDELNEKINNS